MNQPTFEDVVAAREFIAPYLPKTPLIRVRALSELLDCDYYAKLDNLQPVGAFKVRGGVNLVGTASDEEKKWWASSPAETFPSSASLPYSIDDLRFKICFRSLGGDSNG